MGELSNGDEPRWSIAYTEYPASFILWAIAAYLPECSQIPWQIKTSAYNEALEEKRPSQGWDSPSGYSTSTCDPCSPNSSTGIWQSEASNVYLRISHCLRAYCSAPSDCTPVRTRGWSGAQTANLHVPRSRQSRSRSIQQHRRMIHSFVEKLLMGTSLGAIQNWVVQGNNWR